MSDGYKRLPCKLDASEKAARAEELARELTTAVNTGVEQRDVEVRNEVRGTRMETVRCDTWDVVSSRPLDDDERQTALPVDLGERRRKRKTDEPNTDDKPTH